MGGLGLQIGAVVLLAAQVVFCMLKYKYVIDASNYAKRLTLTMLEMELSFVDDVCYWFSYTFPV